MSTGNIDPSKPTTDPIKANVDSVKSLKLQIDLLKEKNKYLEEKVQDQQQYIAKADIESIQVMDQLKQVSKERDNLKLKYGLLKGEMKHVQDSLVQTEKNIVKRGKAVKRQNFIASLFFLQSSVLASIGINMVTSTPPNSLGWAMISIAAASYVIAALMTTIFAEGGN